MDAFTGKIQNLVSVWGLQALCVPLSGCPGYGQEDPFVNHCLPFLLIKGVIILPTINFKTFILMSRHCNEI